MGGGTRTLTVGVGGTYDYNTISSAIADANDGDTIEIHEGTYYEGGIGATKDLNFVGVDKETCIVYNNKGDKALGDVFRLNGGSIKNLTIKETHENPISTSGTTAYKGYCVHIDNELASGKTITIENCIMENKYCACVGIGGQQDCSVIIKDCEMYKYDLNPIEEVRSNGTLYAHINSTDNTTGQFISVQNCNIKSKYGNVFRVDWNNTNGREMSVECIGNTLLSEELGTTNDIVSVGGLTTTSTGNNVNALNYQESSSALTPTVVNGVIGVNDDVASIVSNSKNTYQYSVESGKTYSITTSARAITYIGYSDTEMNVGDSFDSYENKGQTTLTSYEVTIPDGISYMCVCVYSADYTTEVFEV